MPGDVKALLGRALDGEPPLRIDRDEVFAEGRARLRRRRSIAIGGVAGAVVAAALGTTALTGGLLGQPAGDIGPAASVSAPVVPRPPASTTTSSPQTAGGSGLTVSWPALSEALTRQIPWPAEVTSVHGRPGANQDFQFEGNSLMVVLESASGDRSLVVTVEPPNTLRMFCRAGEDCFREERPDGFVIRRKTDHANGTETVLVNIRRSNGAEISVVESPWGDHARPLRLLPDELFAAIGTAPGLGG